MWLGDAKAPDGMRLYAIGDVHGCDRLLAEAHDKIEADLAADPPGDHRIIHIGDYVDRGPASAAVLDRLVGWNEDRRVVCLRGNHDELMRRFLDDPLEAGPTWLYNGGDRTLASYGVSADGWTDSNRMLLDLGRQLAERLPEAHRDFLEGLDYSAGFGDFFFCHAGIRPGIPLAQQSAEDLLWIRYEFLNDSRDFGVVVVHGHTPSPEHEVLRNRINIDTGAVFTGLLTVIALEGTEHRFL